MIINISNFGNPKLDDLIYKIFDNLKSKYKNLLSIEKRNMIRDGIGYKIFNSLSRFPKFYDESHNYYSLVEAMLRASLIYCDQAMFLKYNPKTHVLIDWGVEYLFVYLLAKIKFCYPKKSYNEIGSWLNEVFEPVKKTDFSFLIITKKRGVPSIDIFSALEFVKNNNIFPIHEIDEEEKLDVIYKIIGDKLNNGGKNETKTNCFDQNF